MKFFVFSILTFVSFAQEYSHSTKGVTSQELQSCTQPKAVWVAAVRNIAKITADPQAQGYADVLDNGICAVLTNEAGPDKLAVKYIAMPKYKDKPWIGVVFVGTKTPIPAGAWTEHFRKSVMFAEYNDSINTVIFRDDFGQVPVLKGLIALHEMQHWWQKMNPLPQPIPDLQAFKELNAYEFEFSLLDKLKLPGLTELVTFERARIRQRLQSNQGFETNFSNPALIKVFGPFPSEVGRKNAATIIMIKSLFAEFDSLYSPQASVQKKLNFLHSVYR